MKKLTSSILLAGSLILFSGCQQNVQTPAAKPKIDANLPVVDVKHIKSISDYQSIALEWKSISDAGIKGYYLYRADMQKDGRKFKRVATLENKYITHHLDKDLKENSKYSYSISAIGTSGSESNPSKYITVSTLPNLEAISLVDTVSGLPRQIKILWRPHPNPRVKKYIVEKTTPTMSEWEKLAEVEGRYNIEYIDGKLGDNKIYKYRVKAVTFDDIVSLESDIATGSTKPLPKDVKSFRATKDLPRKIQLAWEPSPTKDVVSYNIYRSTSVDGSFSKIASAPAEHNRFDDNINADGKIYFYKISSVDKDSLENIVHEIKPVMGSTLEKPKMPQITLTQINTKIILNWIAGDDRAVSYNVFKVAKSGWSDSKEKLIPNVKTLRFEDPDIVRGVEYRYAIQAVDENGLVSKKTEYTTAKLPKIPVVEQQ